MLKAEGLVKYYSSRMILDRIDVHVKRGECLGIVGPNGSGKSTLVKLLSGEEKADQGEIWLDGRKLTSYKPKERAQKIAVLAQDGLGEIPFTVEEVVLMGRYPYQTKWWWNSRRDRELAQEMMRFTGIEGYRKSPLSILSGGERQRAIIAKALVQEPELLLLDEPTTYLDIHYQLVILDLLHQYRMENQLTVIMVLHDLNLAAQYCDQIMMIKEGRIWTKGSPEEVFQIEAIDRVFEVEPIILDHPKWHVPQLLLSAKRHLRKQEKIT